jgi:hypothetical protein
VCTVGPTPTLRWSWGWRGLGADYVQGWQVATGNGWDLYGTVAGLFALCLFRWGWRRQRDALCLFRWGWRRQHDRTLP